MWHREMRGQGTAKAAPDERRAQPVERRKGREPGATRETRLGALPRQYGTRPSGAGASTERHIFCGGYEKGRDTLKDAPAPCGSATVYGRFSLKAVMQVPWSG
jgi:hypothetical protein